jgi:hypothetical protein
LSIAVANLNLGHKGPSIAIGPSKIVTGKYALMHLVNCLGNSHYESGRFTGRKYRSGYLSRQAFSFDEGHREEMLTIVLSDFENGHVPVRNRIRGSAPALSS